LIVVTEIERMNMPEVTIEGIRLMQIPIRENKALNLTQSGGEKNPIHRPVRRACAVI
jgi:hypothetical protein